MKDPIIEKQIEKNVQEIIANTSINNDILKQLFSFVDLTTLNITDTNEDVIDLCDFINTIQKKSNIPQVAGICVFPNFIKTIVQNLEDESVRIVSVVGFPFSQTFFSIKFAEAKMAVERGAEEIDVVLPLNKYFTGNFHDITKEIGIYKDLLPNTIVKVILECGALRNYQDIYNAAYLCLESGADFIKSSTGKYSTPSTPQNFYVMATAVSDFYKNTKQKRGIKASGGISTTDEALKYYAIVSAVLGESWLSSDLFRIGSSKLASSIIDSLQ